MIFLYIYYLSQYQYSLLHNFFFKSKQFQLSISKQYHITILILLRILLRGITKTTHNINGYYTILLQGWMHLISLIYLLMFLIGFNVSITCCKAYRRFSINLPCPQASTNETKYSLVRKVHENKKKSNIGQIKYY